MDLATDKPRTATERAKEDCVCFLVPQEASQSELKLSNALYKSLVANLIRHIRSLRTQLDEVNGKDSPPDMVYHQRECFEAFRVKEYASGGVVSVS